MNNAVELKSLMKELNFKIVALEGEHCIAKNDALKLSITLKKSGEVVSKEMYNKIFSTLFLASHIYEENMASLDIPDAMKPLVAKSYRDLAKGTLNIIPDDVKATEHITNEKSACKYVKEQRAKAFENDFSM